MCVKGINYQRDSKLIKGQAEVVGGNVVGMKRGVGVGVAVVVEGHTAYVSLSEGSTASWTLIGF